VGRGNPGGPFDLFLRGIGKPKAIFAATVLLKRKLS